MKKSTDVKKVNRMVRRLNKQLFADVFGKRFEVRQYQKARANDMDYFLYELRDNEDPSRNYIIPEWLNVFDATRKIYWDMNDFIVRSNFWSKYHNKPETYNIEEDSYKKEK